MKEIIRYSLEAHGGRITSSIFSPSLRMPKSIPYKKYTTLYVHVHTSNNYRLMMCIHTYMDVYVSTCVLMYVCMYMRTYTMCIRMYVCAYVTMYVVYTYVYIYITLYVYVRM